MYTFSLLSPGSKTYGKILHGWYIVRKCICSAYFHKAARLKVKYYMGGIAYFHLAARLKVKYNMCSILLDVYFHQAGKMLHRWYILIMPILTLARHCNTSSSIRHALIVWLWYIFDIDWLLFNIKSEVSIIHDKSNFTDKNHAKR